MDAREAVMSSSNRPVKKDTQRDSRDKHEDHEEAWLIFMVYSAHCCHKTLTKPLLKELKAHTMTASVINAFLPPLISHTMIKLQL